MAKGAKKTSKLRWRGVLADSSALVRWVTALMMALTSVALTFTQLGFLGIGLPGDYAGYALTLLLPIAATALLLGTLQGAAMGLFAGVVLYAHARVMPLDFYELSFVTPVTAFGMLLPIGFILGLLFAFVLRNNPSQGKRIVYISIVCIVVSLVYTTGFTLNATIQTLIDYSAALEADSSAEEVGNSISVAALALVLRLGHIGLQAGVDALLMSVVCIIADLAVRKTLLRDESVGMRSTFARWLAVVAAFAYLSTAGISFASVTQNEIDNASTQMSGEMYYLVNQVQFAEKRFMSILNLFEEAGISVGDLREQQSSELLKAVSLDYLLEGYSSDADGTILLMVPFAADNKNEQANKKDDYVIVLSDDDRFKVGTTVGATAGSGVLKGITESMKSDAMERAIFDQISGRTLEDLDLEGSTRVQSEIVYLMAKPAGDYVLVIMYHASKVYAERTAAMVWIAISAFILLFAVAGIVFFLLNRFVVRRIEETNGVLGRITEGDLNARVDIHETREFSSLSDGINETVGALKGWISEAETRMDAELLTAKAIQESALPRTFPPYPDIRRFDVYASMKAAREVGGDFYDFFLIGDDCNSDCGKLGFVVADVSGKGVPAALFMMKAKTQIRDYLVSGMELGEAVENVNRQLCDGNEKGMFVTAWVGVLDYGTRHIDFVNAGHNPPMLWQNGSWRWLTEKSGLPLGLFDGFAYNAYSLECNIGDQFLLYSDGVTEAMDVDKNLYGENRLESLLKENYFLHPRALVDVVRRSVAQFANGAEQSDDITTLALEVGVPPEVTVTLVVAADVNELPRVNEFIHTELDQRLCPLRVQNQIDIAVEELFVNVAHYAYPDKAPDNPGVVRIGYSYSADPPSITIDIIDDGIPYNPLEKSDAVTPSDINEVPIGGLGILMAKRSVDEMRYERIDGSNVLSIDKKW